MIHELKTWPEYFIRVFEGTKKFEIRKNDRHFLIGDILTLKEWDPKTENYTGRTIIKKVTYMLNGPAFGIEEGYCVMSF